MRPVFFFPFSFPFSEDSFIFYALKPGSSSKGGLGMGKLLGLSPGEDQKKVDLSNEEK